MDTHDRVTVEAIAKAAGVSKSSVSRVLGKHPERHHVGPEICRKIEWTAKQLGWYAIRPSKERRRPLFAIIYEATCAKPGEGITSSLANACQVAGVELTFEPITPPFSAWRHRLVHHLKPNGLLAVTPLPTDPRLFEDLPFPIVVVNERTRHALPHVLPDDERAGFLLGQRLFSWGHRRAAYLSPPESFHASVGERSQGLEKAGVHLVRHPSGAAEDVVRGLRFRKKDCPTALVAWAWPSAVEIAFACHRHGFAIPGDVSVVAFDDKHVLATAHPPLTVVDPQHLIVAHEAVRLALLGERRPIELRTPVILVGRLSDGPVQW